MGGKLPVEYDAVMSGELTLPSWVFAYLPPGREAPGISEIGQSLETRLPGVRRVDPIPEAAGAGGQWQAEVEVDWGDRVGVYRLWVEHAEALHEFHFESRGFSEEEVGETMGCQWSIGIETNFGDDCLIDFHNQLRVADAAVPDAASVLDAPACALHPGSWVREVAGTRTPPAPANLYTIHAVYDDEDENAPVWLHTHGLLRCGCLELEILGVRADAAGALGSLLNMTAMLWLESGTPAPDRPFSPAMDVELVWLPCRRGLRKLPRRIQGGAGDRDDAHVHPSALLFLRRGFWPLRRYRPPNALAEMLEDNPLFGISSAETERMSQMAVERWPAFVACFDEHGDDDENWLFLAKLGYAVDDAEDPHDREHLWFRVAQIEEARIEAELMNQPYHIERMNEGDRGWHDLTLLTDWQVMSRFGSYGPDRISLLAKEMARAGAEDADA